MGFLTLINPQSAFLIISALPSAAEARRVEQPRPEHVQSYIRFRPYAIRDGLVFFGNVLSTVCYSAFVSVFHQNVRKIGTYPPRAAYTADGVDLQYLHKHLRLFSRTMLRASPLHGAQSPQM